ncbi:2-amino-4-hydroxy-6-hydroxymethyldihydropteridine diphosphokinase [Lusitaniella coriacea]|uniref:2-amino-4-hydroxy-6- hydroxymethyldihydropteridine diphosphokinase n=1 Tax=Lusitaniella coriacea TaxID=1983105 RepID=UPI003CE77B91
MESVKWAHCQKQIAAAIALGSNLGDSLKILEGALSILAKTPGIELKQTSSWYRTAPIGPPQPDYLNGCAVLETPMAPLLLLETLLDVERQFGRERRERWGPRTLDLDLILFGDLILEKPQLHIPHPRMRERAFVLIPLAEIAPDWVDPLTQKSIAQLRDAVNCSGVARLE